MTSPAKAARFGSTLLLSGPEALLADRQVAERIAACRSETPEAELNDLDAGSLDAGLLAEITGGSLFAERSIAVLRNLANLPTGLADAVLELSRETPPELALILVHAGGQKGKGLLDKLRKTKAVEVIDCAAIKPWELTRFLSAEARRHRIRLDTDAAQLLVDSVGHDLRSLSAAVGQLAADTEQQLIDEQLVRRYFTGRAEATGFAIADYALAGQTAKALEHLRWALATGVSPVLITSALASALRGLGKLSGLRGTNLRDTDLAREVGVPPWKLKTMRGQLRRWDDRRLAGAITAIATADADVKGAADNAEYALERAVLTIAAS